MTSTPPLIAQLQDAEDDRARARLLLSASDAMVLRYADVLAAACRQAGFAAGHELVAARVAVMQAVRDEAGRLPLEQAQWAEELRAGLALFAAEPARKHVVR